MSGLAEVAQALRSLHRALAERARRDVEQQRHAVLGAGEWLQLLTSDPRFAWLRSLSELVVDLDVFLEADPAPADDDAAAVRGEIERLLAPAAAGEFAERYWPYVHDDPHVAIAHGEVRQAIGRLPEAKDVDEADALHARHRWAEARRHRA
ncbi:MAG TPA: hypothetical protein VF059_02890 [Casimicrobiaceae bacterium]